MASASPAWARGKTRIILRIILLSMAMTPILTGVLVSCLEKNPEDSTLTKTNAGSPTEYAIRLRLAICTSCTLNSRY